MRNKIAVALFSIGVLAAQAQDSTSAASPDGIVKNKKGHEILPKKGDIAIGFNTFPIIDLLFGSLNRTSPYAGSSNAVQFTQNSNNQILTKYYLDGKTAIRARFGINTLSGNITNRVQDAKAAFEGSKGTPQDIAAASLFKVEDKANFVKTNWMFTVGYEKRRGYRRLQGFYGGEIGIGNTSSRQNFTYGNGFSNQYVVEYTTDFNNRIVNTQNPNSAVRFARATERIDRGIFRIGARGFIGVEYFIFAKISIAVEYGWAYSITRTRAATSKQEVYFNGQNGPTVIIEDVNNDARSTTKGFAVDNNNGSIFSLNNTLNGNTSLNGGAGALTLLFHF
jgi:hypothetical protein